MKNINFKEFKTKDWIRFCSYIDHEYLGSEPYIMINKHTQYYYITTDKCDCTSMLRVYTDGVGVIEVMINGEHTEGWQEIHPNTYNTLKRFYD